MRTILVTGGTMFVSRFVSEYFAKQGDDVYVLNRNTRPQSPNVTLIEGDRHHLGDTLKEYHFDAVLDMTAYTRYDAQCLIQALGPVKDYILLSSCAVYNDTLPQPWHEDLLCTPCDLWGQYGSDKLAAEQLVTELLPQAYIVRPPYLYGPMESIYREPFVFDCADAGRPFCVPGDGSMRLHFLHIEDLCRFIAILLEKRPEQHIFNVSDPQPVSIRRWVDLCYQAVGKPLRLVSVNQQHPVMDYFCFKDFEYILDTSRQQALMPDTKPLLEGLIESYQWYLQHPDGVDKKPYMEYIDAQIL